MKKLILLILLLPFFAKAQNVTMNKTGGQLRTVVSSIAQDTVPMVTGTLINGYILKWNSSTKKWYASPDPTYPGLQDSLTKKANRTFDNVASGAIAKSKVDTSSIGLQTVSNFFPKGDTRYLRLTGTAANSTLWNNQQYNGTTLTTAPTVIMAFDGSMYRPTSASAIQSFLGITGGPFLPVANPAFTGTLSGPTITATGRVTAGGGDGNGFRVPSNELSGLAPTDGLSLTTAFNVGYLTNKNNGNFRPMYYDALTHNFNTIAGSGDVLVSSNNDGKIDKVTIGSGLSLSAGVLTATGGSSGTVTTAGGTAGRIVKFTSASNVENSVLTESSGNISMSGTFTAGTFSGAGTDLTGTASSLNIGGNAATATNSTQWSGNTINKGSAYGSGITYLSGFDYTAASSEQRIFTAAAVQGFLGLGSNAYSSTAFAPLNSPAFTGNPTAPTQTQGDNSTKIATTAYVDKFSFAANTFTPSLTPVSGVDGATNVTAFYQRINNIVSYTIEIIVDPTSASSCSLLVGLPVASNFNDVTGLAGIAQTETQAYLSNIKVEPDDVSDSILLTLTPTVAFSFLVKITGHYKIQ